MGVDCFVVGIVVKFMLLKLRTIINIPISERMSRTDWRSCGTIIARIRLFGYLDCSMRTLRQVLSVLVLNASMLGLLDLRVCVREASISTPKSDLR